MTGIAEWKRGGATKDREPIVESFSIPVLPVHVRIMNEYSASGFLGGCVGFIFVLTQNSGSDPFVYYTYGRNIRKTSSYAWSNSGLSTSQVTPSSGRLCPAGSEEVYVSETIRVILIISHSTTSLRKRLAEKLLLVGRYLLLLLEQVKGTPNTGTG
jgi:hypothetical protein